MICFGRIESKWPIETFNIAKYIISPRFKTNWSLTIPIVLICILYYMSASFNRLRTTNYLKFVVVAYIHWCEDKSHI